MYEDFFWVYSKSIFYNFKQNPFPLKKKHKYGRRIRLIVDSFENDNKSDIRKENLTRDPARISLL